MKLQVARWKTEDLERLRTVARLAKQLKFLNCFITETFDQVINENSNLSGNVSIYLN